MGKGQTPAGVRVQARIASPAVAEAKIGTIRAKSLAMFGALFLLSRMTGRSIHPASPL